MTRQFTQPRCHGRLLRYKAVSWQSAIVRTALWAGDTPSVTIFACWRRCLIEVTVALHHPDSLIQLSPRIAQLTGRIPSIGIYSWYCWCLSA